MSGDQCWCYYRVVGSVERLAIRREPFGRRLGPGGARPAPPSHPAAARSRPPQPQGTSAPETRGVRTGGRLVSAAAAAANAGHRFPPSDVRVRPTAVVDPQSVQ